MSILRIKELTKTFGSITAVNKLNLSVKEGEIFALVGPDGAGKTTTMRMLSTILEPTSGKAFIDGTDTALDPEAIKAKIGTMSQRFGLYHDLTVEENLEFYSDIYEIPKSEREEKIKKLLKFSHLEKFRRRLADKLSGGMKQKLGLACALIHRPKILFLDEPTNGVDPVSRRDFWRILYQLHREKVTIFFTTSYMDEAERANRLGFLHQGSLLACGTSQEVKNLLDGALLEILVEDPKKMWGLFRTSMHQEKMRLVGNRIHVVAKDPQKLAETLSAFFQKQGIKGYQIRTSEPSLEDVFVSLSDYKS